MRDQYVKAEIKKSKEENSRQQKNQQVQGRAFNRIKKQDIDEASGTENKCQIGSAQKCEQMMRPLLNVKAFQGFSSY